MGSKEQGVALDPGFAPSPSNSPELCGFTKIFGFPVTLALRGAFSAHHGLLPTSPGSHPQPDHPGIVANHSGFLLTAIPPRMGGSCPSNGPPLSWPSPLSPSPQLKGFHLTHTMQMPQSLPHLTPHCEGISADKLCPGGLSQRPLAPGCHTESGTANHRPHLDSMADPQQLPRLPPQRGPHGAARGDLYEPKSYSTTVPTPGDEGHPLARHASSFTVWSPLTSPASLFTDARPLRHALLQTFPVELFQAPPSLDTLPYLGILSPLCSA